MTHEPERELTLEEELRVYRLALYAIASGDYAIDELRPLAESALRLHKPGGTYMTTTHTPLTDADLNAMEAVLRDDFGQGYEYNNLTREDADRLIAEVRRLRTRNAALESALGEILTYRDEPTYTAQTKWGMAQTVAMAALRDAGDGAIQTGELPE